MIGEGATLTFAVEPAAAGRIFVNNRDVTNQSEHFVANEMLDMRVEPNEGFELDNWNGGEYFDVQWLYRVIGDATITAYLSEG